MKHPAVAVGAALAAWLVVPVNAAQLCESTDCRLNLEFDSGGAFSSGSGATITFNSGGSLNLGEGGALDLGEGGSVTPDPGAGAPSFSNGGTLVLGPGGSIDFGTGGSMITAGGNVAFDDGGDVSVSGASSVVLTSPGNIRLGTLASSGDVTVAAGGTVGTAGAIAFDIANTNDDASASMYVESNLDVSVGAFNAANVQVFDSSQSEQEGGGGGFSNTASQAGSSLQAPPSTGALGLSSICLFLLTLLLRHSHSVRRRPSAR